MPNSAGWIRSPAARLSAVEVGTTPAFSSLTSTQVPTRCDYRLRRDHPDLEYDACGNLKVRRKYFSPPGRSNMLYLPPGVPQSLLRDPELPVGMLSLTDVVHSIALERQAAGGSTHA